MTKPRNPIIQSYQEIFRAPIYALDQPTPQSRSESRGEWESEVRSAQLDLLDVSAYEMILEAPPDSLNLRQLGHGPLRPFDSMILTTG